MDFQTIQSEVAAQTRFDSSVAANLVLIKRWINRAQQHIASRHDWSWLEHREVVQTAPDKSQSSPASSTVAVSVSGTTVTGTSTDFASTDVGRYIQFTSASNDWYKITARASTTSLTIEVPFTGTTAIIAGTYIIRSFYYALSANVDRVVSVKQAATPVFLASMSPITLDRWRPFHSDTSANPRLYACWGLDIGSSALTVQGTSGNNYRITVGEVTGEEGSLQPVVQVELATGVSNVTGNGNWVIQFYPWPTVTMNMEVAFYRVPADLSSNTDTGVMPVKLRDTVLVEGALAYGYKYLNDDRADKQMRLFEEMIEAALLSDGQNRGSFTVLEAVDQGPREPSLIQFPTQYPFMGGDA